jgi:hypothetical protein
LSGKVEMNIGCQDEAVYANNNRSNGMAAEKIYCLISYLPEFIIWAICQVDTQISRSTTVYGGFLFWRGAIGL